MATKQMCEQCGKAIDGRVRVAYSGGSLDSAKHYYHEACWRNPPEPKSALQRALAVRMIAEKLTDGAEDTHARRMQLASDAARVHTAISDAGQLVAQAQIVVGRSLDGGLHVPRELPELLRQIADVLVVPHEGV